MEEVQYIRSNSDVSKSAEPFIQIDSISIDLISSDNKSNAGKCEHFSIRGYVSEMCKKDWKKCWPFPLDGDSKSNAEQTSLLPPLDIPHFKWWQCQNCRQEISAKGLQQPTTKLELIEGNPLHASKSTNFCKNCHPSSCGGEKVNKAQVAVSNTEKKIGSEANVNQEIVKVNSIALEKSSLIKERLAIDIEPLALISQSNGCEPGYESHQLSGTEIINRSIKAMGENHIEVFQGGMQPSADNQLMELNCQSTYGVEKARNAVRGPTDSSPELDNRNSTVFEGAEISDGNDVEDHHLDKSTSLPRRKTRKKVRLLTELLGENGNSKTKQVEIEDSPSKGTPGSSSRLDLISIPPCHMSVQQSFRDLGQNTKRKLPQDEEWRPPELSSSYHVKEKFQALEGDAGTSRFGVVSESENVLAGTGIQSRKSHWSRDQIDENHILGEKKFKKPQEVDPCLSALPSRENFARDFQDKLGGRKDENALDNFSLKLLENGFAGRRPDASPMPDTRAVPKSSMNNKKTKNQVAEEGPATLFSGKNGMLRKSSITWTDLEIMQNGSVAIPFQPSRDEPTERGLHLSLNSCSAAKIYDKKCISHGEGGLYSVLPQKGNTSSLTNQVTRKDLGPINYGDLSPFKSPDIVFGQGVPCGQGSKMTAYRIPLMNDKQNLISQSEIGGWSLHKKDVSGAGIGKKPFEFPEHSTVKKKHSAVQRVEKVSDQGALDDIPMEIVELMARNQYERCRHDSDDNKHQLPTNKTAQNAQIIDYSNVYSIEGSRLLHEQESHKGKNQARTGRNGPISSGKAVKSNKRKSVDHFSEFPPIYRGHFNMNHLHQTHIPSEYSAFVQSQNKPPSGVQFSASGSGRHGSNPNTKYNGDMASPGSSSHAGVQAFAGWNECLPASQQNVEAAHMWSQTMPNQFPFGYNIPQKSGAHPSDTKTLSNSHGSMHKSKLNTDHDPRFFNPNGYSLEKNKKNSSSEDFNRKKEEYPFACHTNGIKLHHDPVRPLDLYPNETIPAMHLLSLMDAGAPFPPGHVPHRLPKKPPPIPHDLKAKEISRLGIDLNKTVDSIKYPSPDDYSKAHPSEKSFGYVAASQGVSASSSFQHDKVYERDIAFTGQVYLKPQKEKVRRSNSPTRSRGKNSHKSVYTTTNGSLDTKIKAFPDHGMEKNFFDPSSSIVLASRYQTVENSTQSKFEARDNNGMLQCLKRNSETQLCSVNKNPADFSAPEAGNVYMIGAKDLKPRKRTGPINLDGRKRQRNLKFNNLTVKERVQHLIS